MLYFSCFDHGFFDSGTHLDQLRGARSKLRDVDVLNSEETEKLLNTYLIFSPFNARSLGVTHLNFLCF